MGEKGRKREEENKTKKRRKTRMGQGQQQQKKLAKLKKKKKKERQIELNASSGYACTMSQMYKFFSQSSAIKDSLVACSTISGCEKHNNKKKKHKRVNHGKVSVAGFVCCVCGTDRERKRKNKPQ